MVKPTLLVILDGWGHRTERKNNGIEMANKPFFDSLIQTYPHTLVDGSGPAVGLPKGIMGNSEVGHMNLGAGRIVFSGLSQIYGAIESGLFFFNPALLSAINQAQQNNSTLHLMGLVSDGAVHSHQDHLYALLQLAKQSGLTKVLVHCFLDGRDTSPNDGVKYLKQLQAEMQRIGVGRIASVSGRFFAMDRDKRWDRVEKAFSAISGRSENQINDSVQYVEACYKKSMSDEFIEPAVCCEENKAHVIHADDAMIFFNFRSDRAREITQALTQPSFEEFDRQGQVLPKIFVCMSPYDATLNLPVAFEPTYPTLTLGEFLSTQGLSQLRIAETEKYAHVTFFFNGGRDVLFEREERILIPSPKEVATYDLKPEMSAFAVKDKLIAAIQSRRFDFMICNFANTDMVGHTAIASAVIKAVETVDQCLSQIVPAMLAIGGNIIITADHGNAEVLVDEKGEPMTAHTTNLVPFIVITPEQKIQTLREGGRLCDVAPTVLALMGLPQPEVMTGQSIVLELDS